MTVCNSQSLGFASIARRRVEADFTGGTLSSDTGVLLLREYDERTQFTASLSAAIPDPRDPDLIEHDQLSMIRQRIYGIASGYEDLNDHQTLRHDPLMIAAANRSPDRGAKLASPSTLCRLENRIDRKTICAMSTLLVKHFVQSHREPPTQLILDFDATDFPLHGNQEGKFFHGYYDCHCYLPLYVLRGARHDERDERNHEQQCCQNELVATSAGHDAPLCSWVQVTERSICASGKYIARA